MPYRVSDDCLLVRSDLTRDSPIGSYFATYHTVLRTSHDFITALKNARVLADNLTQTINNGSSGPVVEVFPYSIFYVFYEQYLTIWHNTVRNLVVALSAIFVVTFVFLAFDFMASLLIIATIGAIVVNLMGMMFWWDIPLNAISLVNLVMVCVTQISRFIPKSYYSL